MSKPGHSFLIVLYNQKLSESAAYRDLSPQLTEVDNLIIYDNSPTVMRDIPVTGMIYLHDPTNGGLATAYNAAVKKTRVMDNQWLTIFDQDTRIPDDFNYHLSLAIASHEKSSVLIPSVKLEDGRKLSPFWIEDALFVHYPAGASKTLAAINSGMTLNLASFPTGKELFDTHYGLDFLDYAFFKQLQRSEKKPTQIDVTLTQSLSLSNFRTMSQSRFESFQLSEARFVNEFYPSFKSKYRLRVSLRLVKQLLKRVQWSKVKVMLRVIGGKN
ncbi:dTDP-rhamnosyl transferase [Lacticaseibacillus chiayiensis]|uniref:dTDP-rhamnosyl transferase n=1 Tax=Lacticaseibacillus chiayiensis TaxID=2100821 RepID=A0A4Q1THZ4_9LACO|nr:glycosyltransferase [Lacticaseibacillus chiayiensis]RXT18056.1 dTDP-rhamnosyl transferase [Lacticaseibacillus chiayiensis]